MPAVYGTCPMIQNKLVCWFASNSSGLFLIVCQMHFSMLEMCSLKAEQKRKVVDKNSYSSSCSTVPRRHRARVHFIQFNRSPFLCRTGCKGGSKQSGKHARFASWADFHFLPSRTAWRARAFVNLSQEQPWEKFFCWKRAAHTLHKKNSNQFLHSEIWYWITVKGFSVSVQIVNWMGWLEKSQNNQH